MANNCKATKVSGVIGLNETDAKAFREAVIDASQRDDVRNAIDALYQHVQYATDLRRPVCVSSGRCCRFEEFGHRLFVTTMELAAFVARAPGVQPVETGCPYQVGRLCGVHAIRPFGCRVFFCDETATEWQRQLYDRIHCQLKRMHDDMAVSYYYVEWQQALRALSQVPLLL